MKAKLGDCVVDVWKIGTDKPTDEEDWVIDAFEKKQLAWSGKLVMTALEKRKLRENGLQSESASAAEQAFSWILFYATPTSFANAYAYDIYLVVNQARIPGFGQLGEYLVKAPLGDLEVYSEKKFEKQLKEIN